MIEAILAFLKALPELMKLIRVLQERVAEGETSRQVAEDVKTIHEAFSEKDPRKLNALFSGK